MHHGEAEPALRPFAVAGAPARAVLAGRDARQLALALLTMSQEEFAASFQKSPMERAKLSGLKRNAAVVLGNIGAAAHGCPPAVTEEVTR